MQKETKNLINDVYQQIYVEKRISTVVGFNSYEEAEAIFSTIFAINVQQSGQLGKYTQDEFNINNYEISSLFTEFLVPRAIKIVDNPVMPNLLGKDFRTDFDEGDAILPFEKFNAIMRNINNAFKNKFTMVSLGSDNSTLNKVKILDNSNPSNYCWNGKAVVDGNSSHSIPLPLTCNLTIGDYASTLELAFRVKSYIDFKLKEVI